MLAVLRKVAAVTITVALVLLALGLAVLFWLVRQEGWLVQSVATGSMDPTIPTGSAILYRPVAPADVRPGDIIVFESPTGAAVGTGAGSSFAATEPMLVTHRVVAIEERDGVRGFRTKGDANDDRDPFFVSPQMVRAEYVAHVPAVGGLVSDPASRRWLFGAVALAGLVVIVVETRTIARELRSDREASRAHQGEPDVGAGAAGADASDDVVPDDVVPDDRVPDDRVPDDVVPDDRVPDDGAPSAGAREPRGVRVLSGRHRH